MNRASRIYCVAACVIALFMCVTVIVTWRVARGTSADPARNEVEAFRRTHPAEARQFTEMRPASLRAAMMLVVENNTDAATIARSVKRKWGDVPGVSEYADNAISVETEKLNRTHRMVDDFERETERGGVLFDYVWRDDHTEETGLLVLSGGSIVKKVAFVSRSR